MAFTSRQITVFVAGLAIGVAAAWAVFGRHGGSAESAAAKKAPVASAKAQGAAPVSVAVGAFADPSFPPPHVSVYEERQHPWALAVRELPLTHEF